MKANSFDRAYNYNLAASPYNYNYGYGLGYAYGRQKAESEEPSFDRFLYGRYARYPY
jgi:hypothetical protein